MLSVEDGKYLALVLVRFYSVCLVMSVSPFRAFSNLDTLGPKVSGAATLLIVELDIICIY